MEENLLIDMYEKALTIRLFEKAAIAQYRIGNIYGYLHPYLGEEGVAVGAISALRPDDFIVSTHRGHGHAIAKGHDISLMMAELLGKATGYCKGRGGSMHVANLKQNNLGANGIVGGGIPIAAGAGMAIKQKKTDQVVMGFFSDGAVNNGVFHESMNLAAIYSLPVVYVLENNHYAAATPYQNTNKQEDLSIYANGYGIPGLTIDGNDAVGVYEVALEAVKHAREGQGPTLIECKTYRHQGHHVNDPGAYMPQDQMAAWKAKDPVEILRNYLESETSVTVEQINAINQRVEALVDQAVRFANESPAPSAEQFLSEIPQY
jgi:acetoin:2,6-dichlorophenolindophenol oxidoreductase subunit alpha